MRLLIPLLLVFPLQDIDSRQNKNTCSHIPYIEPSSGYSLKNAEELESTENFDEAIKIYAYIMKNHKNNVIKSNDNTYLGAWYYSLKRISSWPAKGKTAYKNYFDKECELAFSRAKSQRDRQQLVNVAREYPYSTFAIPALVHSANLATEEGDIEEAIPLLEEVLGSAKTTETVESTAKKLAFLYNITGEKKKLQTLESKFEIQYIKDLLAKTIERTPQDTKTPNHDKFGDFTRACQIELPAVKYTTAVGSDGFYRNSEFNPHMPTLKDGFLYIANDYSIRAYDLFSSGEMVWNFDLPPPPGELTLNDRVIHYIKVEDGICYLNLITSLGKSEVIKQWGLTAKYPFPKRSLFALDAYNGKLLWKKDDLSYTSAPCIDNNCLYVGGIKQKHPTDPFEHHLICLNKNTGDTVWNIRLAKGVTEINLFGNCIRESIGSPAIVNGDTVFYCTNLGAAVGAEKNTGSIKWLFKYDTVPIESTRFYPVTNPRGWINNRPLETLAGFIFTPTDSEYLYHVDKETGKVLYNIKRQNLDHILGIADNKLFLAGSEIAVFNVETAKREFAPIKCNTSGSGTIADGFIIVPTLSDIFFYDSKTLKLSKALKGYGANSNLTVGEESLVFTNSNGVTEIFFEKMDENVRYENNPALVKYKRAITWLRKKDLVGAKRLFENVLKEASKTPSMAKLASLSKARLYLILVKLLEKSLKDQDWITAENQAQQALEICKSEEDEINLLFKLSYINSRKDPRKAISILQRMIKEYPNHIHESHSVFDTAKEIIDVIIRNNGRSVYKELDSKAKELFEAGVNLKSPIDLQKVFDLYPNSEFSEKALSELVKIFLENEKYDDSITTFRKTIKYFPNSDKIPQFHADLAKCYQRKKLFDSAQREITLLKTRYPNSSVSWDNKTYKPEDLLALIKTERPAHSSAIRVPVSKLASVSTSQNNQILGINEKNLVLQSDDLTLTAYDLKSAKQSYKFQTNSRINYTSQFEDILVICCSNSIYLLDMTQGQKIWEYNQNRMISPSIAANGFLACSSTKGMSSEIIVFDIISKSKLWSAFVKGITGDISITSLHIVVKTHNPESIYIFDASSGTKKDEKTLEKKSFRPGSILKAFEETKLVKYDNSLVAIGNKNWEIPINENAVVHANEQYSVILEQSKITVVENKNGKRVAVKDVFYKKLKSSLVHNNLIIAYDNKVGSYSLPDLSLDWEATPYKYDSNFSSLLKANTHILLVYIILGKNGEINTKIAFLNSDTGRLEQEVKSVTSTLPVEVDIFFDKLLIKDNEQIDIYK